MSTPLDEMLDNTIKKLHDLRIGSQAENGALHSIALVLADTRAKVEHLSQRTAERLAALDRVNTDIRTRLHGIDTRIDKNCRRADALEAKDMEMGRRIATTDDRLGHHASRMNVLEEKVRALQADIAERDADPGPECDEDYKPDKENYTPNNSMTALAIFAGVDPGMANEALRFLQNPHDLMKRLGELINSEHERKLNAEVTAFNKAIALAKQRVADMEGDIQHALGMGNLTWAASLREIVSAISWTTKTSRDEHAINLESANAKARDAIQDRDQAKRDLAAADQSLKDVTNSRDAIFKELELTTAERKRAWDGLRDSELHVDRLRAKIEIIKRAVRQGVAVKIDDADIQARAVLIRDRDEALQKAHAATTHLASVERKLQSLAESIEEWRRS